MAAHTSSLRILANLVLVLVDQAYTLQGGKPPADTRTLLDQDDHELEVMGLISWLFFKAIAMIATKSADQPMTYKLRLALQAFTEKKLDMVVRKGEGLPIHLRADLKPLEDPAGILEYKVKQVCYKLGLFPDDEYAQIRDGVTSWSVFEDGPRVRLNLELEKGQNSGTIVYSLPAGDLKHTPRLLRAFALLADPSTVEIRGGDEGLLKALLPTLALVRTDMHPETGFYLDIHEELKAGVLELMKSLHGRAHDLHLVDAPEMAIHRQTNLDLPLVKKMVVELAGEGHVFISIDHFPDQDHREFEYSFTPASE